MGRGEILDPIGRGRSRDWADGSRHVPGWIGGDRGGRREAAGDQRSGEGRLRRMYGVYRGGGRGGRRRRLEEGGGGV